MDEAYQVGKEGVQEVGWGKTEQRGKEERKSGARRELET